MPHRFVWVLALLFLVTAPSAWAQDEPPSTEEVAKPDTTAEPLGDVPEVKSADESPLTGNMAGPEMTLDGETWATVESEAGAYRADMPGETVDTVQVNSTAMGPLDVHMKFAETDDNAYLVGYMDVPGRDTTLTESELLENIVERLKQRPSLTSISDTSRFRFEGYPGRFLQFKQGNLNMRWAYRAIGMRVYMQGFVSGEPIDPDEAQRYFDSFEITQPADSIAAIRIEQPHLDRLLTQIGWEYEIEDDGDYALLLTVDSTRSQGVWIRSVNSERAGEPAGYEVYSQVMYADAAPSPSFMEAMLRENGPHYGSFELFDGAEGTYSVFYSAFTPDIPDADALYNVVADVVTIADQMEKEWIGGDEY